MSQPSRHRLVPSLALSLLLAGPARGEEAGGAAAGLERQLRGEDPAALAREARERGDPGRGAIIFFRPVLGCAQCHDAPGDAPPVGPDLTRPAEGASAASIIESLLEPSRAIRQGFEAAVVLTRGGTVAIGIPVADGPEELVLREAPGGKSITVKKSEIARRSASEKSLMPEGLVNQLGSRQEFLDLAAYLQEIAARGKSRALELRPPPSFFAPPPIPEYENDIDHAGMIADLDARSLRRGEEIYERVCASCHGTLDQPGTLPTSPRFAADKLKNGSDPFSMYRTLTHGYGMMVPQTWMVPQQKYDVIHYIRETYFLGHNPTQYARADEAYRRGLPPGSSRGPEPSRDEPWTRMDYGPSLINTIEVGSDGSNIARKGIAVRLDPGPGGLSRGRYFMLYEHDTLRASAGWSGEGFIDWNGIHFNGRHEIHPRIAGRPHFENPEGPGWADPETGSFEDPRPRGRDGRPYGPLPRNWARYRGLYHYADRAIIDYEIGGVRVLEMPGIESADARAVFTRAFSIGPRERRLTLQAADLRSGGLRLRELEGGSGQAVLLGPEPAEKSAAPPPDAPLAFDGSTHVEMEADGFELRNSDYSITAKIKTRSGGTIFAETPTAGRWVPGGKTLFLRDGRLAFDIGWVGVVHSKRRIADGDWHEVAATWRRRTGSIRLYIDGRLEGEGRLEPKADVEDRSIRIGYTAPNFPERTFFEGRIAEVRFYRRALEPGEIPGAAAAEGAAPEGLVARWNLEAARGRTVEDASGNGRSGKVIHQGEPPPGALIAAAVAPPVEGASWMADQQGRLRLSLPPGSAPLRFTLKLARVDGEESARQIAPFIAGAGPAPDLAPLIRGGPPRWTAALQTRIIPGPSGGPFAVDVLAHPDANPWSCRMRFGGLDFLPGGEEAVVCSWDGDVWRVSGIAGPEGPLVWRRIASGLFQPLGIKVIGGRIHVTCRDQIVILDDLDGDGETDYYECFNSDHQVTEHFHEFASGLETDAAGNLYYMKGARHGKEAVVPHHGTLLRVSPDGSRTDILATGFRAPNGLCVNPDGTFFATDQEGHWTPKNRINWIRPGKFYGYFWGYHDVADPSDDAMEPPLCWITNAMDRSPAEPLRVPAGVWGPLAGSLLNLSYGYGKVYVVPYELASGRLQGGVCELPLPQFPTGVHRGRFHPGNGHLYLAGLFAWAGSQTQPGGFYRVRWTGAPLRVPVGLRARTSGLEITFGAELDPESAADPANYAVKTWSIKRAARYGSDHHDEKRLEIAGARLADGRRTVTLDLPAIAPTWCMEIRFDLRAAGGAPVRGVIHNTIHALGE